MNDIVAAPADRLHELADRLGLLRQYVSAAGDTRHVSDESLRALSAALGFAAQSDADAERSLDELAKGRGRPLDPVIVVIEGRPLDTAWRASKHDQQVAWRLVEENGAVREGMAPVHVVRAVDAPSGDARLRLPLDGVAIGYHRLDASCGDNAGSTTLIVVPPRAYLPEEWGRDARRDWAITAQLYSLRSSRNWGIGDFSDLGVLADRAAGFGASAIGLNPLHALFPANPRHLSPYSPSSRAFLNPIYIDVESVPEWVLCDDARAIADEDGFANALQAARDSEFVDYEAVWRLKGRMLLALYRALCTERSRQPGSDRAVAFEAFKQAGGDALKRFATFEALQQHFLERGAGLSWRGWPSAYRDAGSTEVAAFAAEHADAVELSQYLQWEADRQLGLQADAMRRAGMTTGLYRDVAVGVDPNGAEAWGDQSLLVAGAAVGAPPDVYNPNGQDWGLTPFNPIALQRRAFAPFIAAIRASMRHAGAIRIDHVIGLKRLYWVPIGMTADAGGYIAYPFDELMGIVALESWRHRCFVVGEDLGTVPEGFREDAERLALLSYRVLMFEREGGDGAFLPPTAYPELAAAAVSTHDLPTLVGLFTGRDLEWRRDLGLYPSPQGAEREIAFRQATRAALLEALAAHGGLSPQAVKDLAGGQPLTSSARAELLQAAHRFLAAAPSRLLLVQLEDLAGEVEQMNLPGTVDAHPNWRRKLRPTLEELFADAVVIRIATSVQETRVLLSQT